MVFFLVPLLILVAATGAGIASEITANSRPSTPAAAASAHAPRSAPDATRATP
jgi:hypothetical protein